MERVVVAGAGLAGLRAVEELREQGFDGALTVLGNEPHRPYTRPPLSKQLLAGEMEPGDLPFDCDGLGVEWVLGDAAASLDTRRRVVVTRGAEELPYDGLVIATGRGARPWPALPELDGFFTLRTLDDALALRDAVRDDSKVVVVGGGFVGCEVAATLRGRGVDVTIVELAPHPMPVLGPEAGAFAAAIHEAHGVKLRLGAEVDGFEGSGRVEAVCLNGGERLDADVVLLAVGSTPNTAWLADSGVELAHGAVLCDRYCVATGFDAIVAAGDVAAWPHPHADGPVCVEHWTHAAEMGRVAARNLLADPEEREAFRPVPTFWSDQYDVKIKSAGLFGQATSTHVVTEDADARRIVVEGRRGDDLLGAVLFNKNKSFIEYRRRLAGTLAGAQA